MKSISIECRSTPEQSGYLDRVTVLDGEAMVFHDFCSTCPNPFRPSDCEPWEKAYAWLALGRYNWQCTITKKHGKCLSINRGGKCETRNPNSNHDNTHTAYSILIHKGYSATWKGSAGCLTLPPDLWDAFIKLFNVGDSGELVIMKIGGMIA